MAEFRIKRAAVLKSFPLPCKEGIEKFDEVAREQGHGEPDIILPDGWSEVYSEMLYQRYPTFHMWLMRRGLIPRDDVARRYPNPIYTKNFYPKDA